MIYVMDFVRKSVEVLENEKLHNQLMRGAVKTKVYDWNEIGALWWRMLNKLK
jgi:hypothetical protein